MLMVVLRDLVVFVNDVYKDIECVEWRFSVGLILFIVCRYFVIFFSSICVCGFVFF